MEVGVNGATEGSHPSIDLPGCSLSHLVEGNVEYVSHVCFAS